MSTKDIACPHDKIRMTRKEVGEAELDVCGKCGGQFFDSGEMFAAFGVKADPSYWDREETGGVVRGGSKISCPRCQVPMLIQDIKYEEAHVEIDRCGTCGGIYLDKGEIDSVMAIGDKLQPLLDAQKEKARADLEKHLETVDFAPGLISRFLRMFKKSEKAEPAKDAAKEPAE